MENSDPKGALPDLFYLEMSTNPLAFRVTLPIGENDRKHFVLPITEEAAVDVVMQLLSHRGVAGAVWPKVAAIFQEALRQNAAEEAAKEPSVQ